MFLQRVPLLPLNIPPRCQKKYHHIKAHENTIEIIEINFNGTKFSSASDKGTIIRLNVDEVSVLGRATQGVTLMRTNDGGKVVSIETIEPEEE